MAYPRCYLLRIAYLSHLVPLLTAALSFHYDFSIPGVLDDAYLMYLNDSHAAGDRISFTAMTTWSTGRVAYTEPVHLWDNNTGKGSSFTTSFSFAIGGNMNGSRADGIVFVISVFPPKLPSQSSGWLLGLYNTEYPSRSPPTIGVEFDTYWNSDFDPPGKTDHMGIDINWIKSTNYTELPKLALYGTMSANITYDAESKMMVATLWLADGSSHSVQTPVDFRKAGIPQDASVGFSASTGTLFEEHQLFSWSFNSTDTAPTDPPSKTKKRMKLGSIIAAAVVGGGVLFIIIVAAYRWFRQDTRNIQLPVVREFLYGELIKATNNFHIKLGAGAFGEVYWGELRHQGEPQLVAVKKLTRPLEETRKHFVNEVHILGQLSHRNLVKLLGWCWHRNLASKIFCQCFGRSSDKLLLVYELVSNKSLDEHLHDAGRELLAWPDRYKIVLGIGAAIDYLHNGSREPILHRDIKPSNVMLDEKFEPKLGDFGLVRQVDTGRHSLRDTEMIGTRHYIDPKIKEIKSATTASDMYSFGLVLLEMATGTKPTVSVGDEHLPADLVNLIREAYGNGTLLEMADERLKRAFDKKQMDRVLVVGLWCTQLERQNRPDIKEAVKYLSDLELQAPGSFVTDKINSIINTL